MKGEDEFTKEYDDRLREACGKIVEDYFYETLEDEIGPMINKFFLGLCIGLLGVIMLLIDHFGAEYWMIPIALIPLIGAILGTIIGIKTSYTKKFRYTHYFAIVMSIAYSVLLCSIVILEMVY